MDLGRGNLLFPQIWGDLRLLSDEDVAFLARIQKLAKENEAVLHKQKVILGDPWKNEVYGYAYFDGSHGFLFMNNVSFEARRVSFRLDETLGMKAPAGSKLGLLAHFPDQEELHLDGKKAFESGETIDTWLRPFEVTMWEVVPEGSQATLKGFRPRDLPTSMPEVQSQRLGIEAQTIGAGMEIQFGGPEPTFRSAVGRPTLEELRQKGYAKRIIARRAKLPELDSKPAYLAIAIKLRKGGKWWRYIQLADILQIKGMVDDQQIQFEAVPNFRQTLWANYFWQVFRTRMSPTWSGKNLKVAINAYLPPEVESEEEAWIVPEWWK
jgi:hypothetical protein